MIFVVRKALVEKLSFMTILCHFGCVIPNIHVTLDDFSVTLDISCHFGQCHKRPCFLLVKGLLPFWREIALLFYSKSWDLQLRCKVNRCYIYIGVFGADVLLLL